MSFVQGLALRVASLDCVERVTCGTVTRDLIENWKESRDWLWPDELSERSDQTEDKVLAWDVWPTLTEN